MALVRSSLISVFALVGLSAVAPAQITWQKFNAFINTTATTNGGHADGAVAVGGNWNGSGYDPLQGSYAASFGTYSSVGMYVGGNVNFSNGGSLNNSGLGYVAGSFTTANPFNVNGGKVRLGSTYSGPANANILQNQPAPVNQTVFTQGFSEIKTAGAAVFGLTATAINTTDPNNWGVNVSSISGTHKVLSIDGSKLSLLRTLDITGMTAQDTVTINVTGLADITGFGISLNTNTGGYNRVMWNFGNISNFSITDRAFHGTLYAPYTKVKQYQNIDGNLVANAWESYNSVEVHYGPGKTFDGVVPEPASMVALGLGVVGLLRRRKQS